MQDKTTLQILNIVLNLQGMIHRTATLDLQSLLDEFPAVALLGPRQVGKTTLAIELASRLDPHPVYLDLENPADLAKLRDPVAYFSLHEDRMIILDEIQRVPELFAVLRGVIDHRRRIGRRTGQFLILGSASLDLIRQSSESLAGRIAYKELAVINATEVVPDLQLNHLWLRGGFPDSLLARDDRSSMGWRAHFISTYLERDVPEFGPRIPAVNLRRLWTMLAHEQGGIMNASRLAANLGVSSPTVKSYVDLLEDLLLIRSLSPWSGNVGKRLVKSPKKYIRDSGLTHALLNITSMDDLLGHPVVGHSWEGFVIENLVTRIPMGSTSWFYRTSSGAEIDLILELSPQKRIAIEIKRSSAPTVSRGFHIGCEDIDADERFVVYPGSEHFPLGDKVQAIPLTEMMKWITDSKYMM